MKAKIYYKRGDKDIQFVLESQQAWRQWVQDLGASVSGGGLFCGKDFAFPSRNIYYIEKLED